MITKTTTFAFYMELIIYEKNCKDLLLLKIDI